MTTATSTIQLTDIDEQLKKLWHEAQGQNKIRASLFNLILYVQKREAAFYQKMIHSVISKFPCRILLAIVDEESEAEYFKSQASLETVSAGELQIFCELIQVEATAKFAERIYSILLPHVLPDLPVYLLWTDDPQKENALMTALEPFAEKIIFDVKGLTDLSAYAETLTTFCKRFHCDVGDLNWTAASGWRRLFSSAFNDFQAFSTLTQCKEIRIDYNKKAEVPQENTKIRALYFQSWIATRLQWKYESVQEKNGQWRLLYSTFGGRRNIEVVLQGRDAPDLKPGAILGIEVDCLKDQAHWSFKRHAKTNQVFIQYSDKNRCDLPSVMNLSAITEDQPIIEEIFYPTAKEHFYEMLNELKQISWRQ